MVLRAWPVEAIKDDVTELRDSTGGFEQLISVYKHHDGNDTRR